jgi:hypothetical protein
MSERMKKIIELGEDLRQDDIAIGRRLEQERVLGLLEGERQTVDRGLTVDYIIALIRGDV